MNKNDKQNYWSDLKTEVDKILLSDSAVKPGLMFGYPAYYVNGKLALCHYENGIALKLPSELTLMLRNSEACCKPFCPMGKKMGENWVVIYPDEARDIHNFSKFLFASITFLKEITE